METNIHAHIKPYFHGEEYKCEVSISLHGDSIPVKELTKKFADLVDEFERGAEVK